MFDYSAITPYLVAANIVLTWVLGIYVHLTSRSKAITARLDIMETEIAAARSMHAERLARLESNHAQAPTHADLGRLHDKVNRVAEISSRMEGQLDGMDATLRLILNRLTEKGSS